MLVGLSRAASVAAEPRWIAHTSTHRAKKAEEREGMGGFLSYLLGSGGDAAEPQVKEELPANWDDPDPATGLTPRQKRAVVDTWALVQPDLKATGIAVLIALFEAHPEHQRLFSAFRDVPLSELRKSKRFAAHASSVMHAIASLVDTLEDDTEVLVELLTKIGVNHAKHNIPPHAFADLQAVILQLFQEKLGEQLSPEAAEAWDKTLTVANSVVCKQLSAPAEPSRAADVNDQERSQEE